MVFPPVARFFLASLRAIATACFCGRPELTNSSMLELIVFCEEPLASGMIVPVKLYGQ
jgi:hypothetical protein